MVNYLERYAKHIKPEIKALIERGNVTIGEYAQLRMNTYERNALLPALDNACLMNLTEGHLKECSISRVNIPTTYDEVVIQLIVPELLQRLAQTEKIIEFTKDKIQFTKNLKVKEFKNKVGYKG